MRQGFPRSVAVATMSAAVTVFVAFGPGAAFSHAAEADESEQHCQSFAYQQDAQAEWEKWGPADPWRWDPDGDGKVCESSPSRPDAAAATTAPATDDGALPAGAPPDPGTTTAPPAPAPEPSSSAAPAPPAPPSTEAPWNGSHTWGHEDDYAEDPRPVGGVQAGGGGEAGGADSGVPVLPLAGVALGALLLTAGAKRRTRTT